MILPVVLALPLAAALLCSVPVPARRAGRTHPIAGPGWAAALTIASSGLVLWLAVIAAARVSTRDTSLTAIRGILSLDALSALIVLLIALVSTTAAIYSWGYMGRTSGHEPGRLRLYYASYNLFVFAMLAIPMVAEPTLVWICVELTTLSSALLVSFESTQAALEAAWKYVTLSLMGAAIALLGILVLFAALEAAGGGPFTWEGLLHAAPRMPPALLKVAFVLILAGLGTKVGFVPLHTWLPDAHSQAPSPVCALLSGIETTSVLYVILRLLPVLDAAPLTELREGLVIFGLISVGAAAFLLLQVRDYKRLFAFSTVEHMGIILFAAGLASRPAHYGALYQVVSHTLTKSFCFFAAGAVVLAVTTRDIASVRGLIRVCPAAAVSLLLGGLAIAGAPPFAVFLSELSILRAGLAEGRYVAVGLLTLFIAIAFCGVLLHINRMVFGPASPPDAGISPTPGIEGAAAARTLPASCTAMLIVAGTGVIVLGLLLPTALHELLRLACARL